MNGLNGLNGLASAGGASLDHQFDMIKMRIDVLESKLNSMESHISLLLGRALQGGITQEMNNNIRAEISDSDSEGTSPNPAVAGGNGGNGEMSPAARRRRKYQARNQQQMNEQMRSAAV